MHRATRSRSPRGVPRPRLPRLPHGRASSRLSGGEQGPLTRASNTSVSKVSLSEFSIMMLNSASRVSWRNCGDTGRGVSSAPHQPGRLSPGSALMPPWARHHPGRCSPQEHFQPTEAKTKVRDQGRQKEDVGELSPAMSLAAGGGPGVPTPGPFPTLSWCSPSVTKGSAAIAFVSCVPMFRL